MPSKCWRVMYWWNGSTRIVRFTNYVKAAGRKRWVQSHSRHLTGVTIERELLPEATRKR